MGLGALTACGRKQTANQAPGMSMAVPVVAVEAKRQPVTKALSLVGSLLADELVEIKSKTDGTVVEVTRGLQSGEKVITEGTQKVRPGGRVKANGQS